MTRTERICYTSTTVSLVSTIVLFSLLVLSEGDLKEAKSTPRATVTINTTETATATATVTAKAKPRATVTATVTAAPRSTDDRVSRSYARKARSGGPTEAQWAKLRRCENGGKYTSKPGAQYRGAYQFDYGTWRGQGGHGDPAKASPAEQDMRARSLYADRGAAPWPICGKYL